MQVYGVLGLTLLTLGAIPFARFGYFLAQGRGDGHIQSLVLGTALWFIGGQMFITGMLALAISWNRRMLEDVLYGMRGEHPFARSVQADVRRSGRMQPDTQEREDEAKWARDAA